MRLGGIRVAFLKTDVLEQRRDFNVARFQKSLQVTTWRRTRSLHGQNLADYILDHLDSERDSSG